ncbi:hypothetical protein EWM64_g7068 [Hericium alpestre]|uniref:Macro-like domain-containing protein n=1 Tax=Hericium alpestre TaxID=135208 RepID=A0A4Y9ZSC4_9AGAM|nr:hypothetical protein EWM64_g7068 [Hericium alpestre]
MSEIPHFILINPPPRQTKSAKPAPSLCDAWTHAIQTMLPESLRTHFTVYEGHLNTLPAAQLACDCIVSPANSYGIMDGGYDMALSVSFKGNDGTWTLTRCAQAAIRERWRGYAPPSSCTITSIPEEVSESHNPWGAASMAIVPTIRQPEDVSWHKDLVYNSMWSLLVEISQWNRGRRTMEGDRDAKKIDTVLMTGLATGWGQISTEKCAWQMMLAVKHFVQGIPEGARWDDMHPIVVEVDATLELQGNRPGCHALYSRNLFDEPEEKKETQKKKSTTPKKKVETGTDALRRHQKSRHNGIIIEPSDQDAMKGPQQPPGQQEPPSAGGSKSRSRSGTPGSKGKAVSARPTPPAAMAQPTTAGPAQGPPGYYRQHGLNNDFMVFVPPRTPQGVLVDPNYAAMGLPTSAARMAPPSWPPPPWASEGHPMAPYPPIPGAPPGYFQYYRPGMLPPHINPELMGHLPNGAPPPPPSGQPTPPARTAARAG